MESKKVGWFTRIFEDYYLVEVTHKDGKTRTFHMKSIKKITNTLLKGVNLSGHSVEYCTHEPFDYHVKKIY